MNDGYFTITLIHMSCHWCLLLSLTTPPLPLLPPSPPQPFPPQAAQANPLAALSPPLQQLGAAASQRCGVLHACPVFLLAPLLAARRWRGVFAVSAYAPCLQPFCSVNPHCLVVLFELT